MAISAKPVVKNKVSPDELKAIIKAEIANCDGTTGSELSNERVDNLDRYYCRLYGTELQGRSSVVTSDVRDTIEWAMPPIMRIFASGENVCQFEPEEEGDIQAAKQATEYVNFIWNRDNPGFLNLYTWIKDALISKNGTVKIYYNKTERIKRERYSGLDDAAFASLVNDENVTVSEHTETTQDVLIPDLRPEGFGEPQKQEVSLHDLVVTRKQMVGRVCVDPMPPEEFLISRDARSIEDARLCGHKRLRPLSDLIEEGFDREKVEGLPSDEVAVNTDQEKVAADSVNESSDNMTAASNNKSMREVLVTECYIKVDVDGDGIAEMRKVTVAGPGYEILSDEAWDAPRPFVSLTPVIVPHRFIGLALADLAKTFQLLRTTVLRQYLDNLYLSNNQREEVLESQIVNPEEVLSSKPGQKIRVKAMGSVMPIAVPNIGAQALEGMNYLDQLKESSTGVSARTQGLGSNVLHETARGEAMLMNAAMGKIELMARVLAETGIKDAFRLIHRLTCMYQDGPRTVRLTGDKFVSVDPSNFNPDMDMTVSVGLGTGDPERQLLAATVIGEAQMKQFPLGTVTPENVMATNELIVNATGQKGVERFFTLPDPNAPPKPDPEMAKVQAEGAAKQAQLQQDGQIKAQQSQTDAALKTQQQQQDAALAIERMNREFELKRYQIDAEMTLKERQLVAELGLKERQMVAELAMQERLGVQGGNVTAKTSQVEPGGEPG